MSNPTFTFSHQTFGTNSGVPIMNNYSNYSLTNPNTIVSNTYMTPSFGLMDEGFNIQVGLFALNGLKLKIAFKTIINKKQIIINKATNI